MTKVKEKYSCELSEALDIDVDEIDPEEDLTEEEAELLEEELDSDLEDEKELSEEV
jgi:hypothetical protein